MNVDSRSHPNQIHATAFVASSAVVVGDVTIGAQASIWFGAVIRGDTEQVFIGDQSNVQDGSILHADPGQPCRLGARVSLGHGALVHGATVEDEVLVGMRATVLNGAHIGRGSIIAAGALVPPGTVVPPRSMVMGLPGRVVRETDEADLAGIRLTAEHYVEYARAYLAGGAPGGEFPLGSTEEVRLLRGLAVFDGLGEAELRRIASICRPAACKLGDVLVNQGAEGLDMYVVREGLLEVSVGEQGHADVPPYTVVQLGAGQIVGEMSLVDHGPRSATIRCVTDNCSVLVMAREAFERLCAADHHIGLVVYRNLAADLSFKMRHRHLARR